MDNFQVGKRALAWSYISQLFQYGSSVLVLPVILNRLPSEDMAIWYIFLSINSIVSLVDFGFSPSLTKQVSFVFSGVNSLQKDGVVTANANNYINYSLLNDLFHTCRTLYKKISIVIGALLVSLGSCYLYYALKVGDNNIWFAWLLYIVSLVVNFYFSYILIFIRGRGLIEENNKLIIISKALYIVLLFFLIIVGCGVFSLVVANLLSTVLMFVLGQKYVLTESESAEIKKYSSYNDITSTIWYNAKRYGVTNLGVVLLAQSNIFLGGMFLDITSVGQLGLTIQVFTILTVVSKVALTSYMPKFSSLFVANDVYEIKRYFFRAQFLNYIIYIPSSIILIIWGNQILVDFIHSNTLLPEQTVLVLYFFFYLMELTHGNCVSVISAENKVPFYKASIISGITSITVTFICVWCGLGIYSFPIGLISGSLPYNSWKWPLELYKRLN